MTRGWNREIKALLVRLLLHYFIFLVRRFKEKPFNILIDPCKIPDIEIPEMENPPSYPCPMPAHFIIQCMRAVSPSLKEIAFTLYSDRPF